MKRMRSIGIVSFAALIIVLGVAASNKRSYLSRPPTLEEKEIFKDTLARAVWDREQAKYKLDPTILSDAYINDPRGEISEEAANEVRTFLRENMLISTQVGALDYYQMVIARFQQTVVKTIAIQKKMKDEGRANMTQAEIQSFWDQDSGTFSYPITQFDPPASPEKIKAGIKTQSVYLLSADFAMITAEEPSCISEYDLAKVGDRWYIAGGRGIKCEF